MILKRTDEVIAVLEEALTVPVSLTRAAGRRIG
jgi:hypothetical protein